MTELAIKLFGLTLAVKLFFLLYFYFIKTSNTTITKLCGASLHGAPINPNVLIFDTKSTTSNKSTKTDKSIESQQLQYNTPYDNGILFTLPSSTQPYKHKSISGNGEGRRFLGNGMGDSESFFNAVGKPSRRAYFSHALLSRFY